MASPHSVNVNIRARPREVEQWRAAAVHADETLSAWIRVTLNRLSRRPVDPVIEPHRIDERADIMLPRVNQRSTARSQKRLKRRRRS